MANLTSDLLFGLSPAWRAYALGLGVLLAFLYLCAVASIVGDCFERCRGFYRRRRAQRRAAEQAALLASLKPGLVRSWSEPAAKGFNRQKYDAIVGGRR